VRAQDDTVAFALVGDTVEVSQGGQANHSLVGGRRLYVAHWGRGDDSLSPFDTVIRSQPKSGRAHEKADRSTRRRRTLIGTGKADFIGYLIAGKRFERIDLHANLGYTVVGQPVGITLDNTLNEAVGAIWQLSPWTELYGEVLANTSSAPLGSLASSVRISTLHSVLATNFIGWSFLQ